MAANFSCGLAGAASALPHFWEHTIGSGHAPLALRADENIVRLVPHLVVAGVTKKGRTAGRASAAFNNGNRCGGSGD